MSESPGHLPPLPPSPVPAALLAWCRAALVTSRVRVLNATLEVHLTHLRIQTPAIRRVSAYARRMHADDLVLAFDQIRSIRPVGTLSVIVELPYNAAVALAGPAVRATLEHLPSAIPVEPRRFRPFFLGFWLVNNRTARLIDSRPLP